MSNGEIWEQSVPKATHVALETEVSQRKWVIESFWFNDLIEKIF